MMKHSAVADSHPRLAALDLYDPLGIARMRELPLFCRHDKQRVFGRNKNIGSAVRAANRAKHKNREQSRLDG
jgi:hypothetical protein